MQRTTTILIPATLFLTACASPFERIDRHTTKLLAETNAAMGRDTVTPRLDWPKGSKPAEQEGGGLYDDRPPTDDPDADELQFQPDPDTVDVVQRLDRDFALLPDAVEMNLDEALRYAFRHSREYRFAEEDYVLEVLRLLSERHLWGPRFFNDLLAEATAIGDGTGFYETSATLLNDFRVTQRLPYGGEIVASILAQTSQTLLSRIISGNDQSVELVLNAEVPLLRNAGQIAREDLIQGERNVVYAARRFERFRREFLVSITTDFLDLVVRQQAIENARRGVAQFEESEQRERALVEAGRKPPFDAALAAQDTLFARDNLTGQIEAYRLAVDRFQVRLGMPEALDLIIVPSAIGLPVPEMDMSDAVLGALEYRLDLQNRHDFIDDTRRGVNNARNQLLADLDVIGSVSVSPDNINNSSFRAAMALGLPLDRTIERLDLRQSQIDLERAIREYDRFRDTVAVEVRAAVRAVDRARFSTDLQEENVRIAESRVASIEAAPDRASVRDRSDAVIAMQAARDDFRRAQRDLQVAILQYLLTGGRLRVEPDGMIQPLRGMELGDARHAVPGRRTPSDGQS